MFNLTNEHSEAVDDSTKNVNKSISIALTYNLRKKSMQFLFGINKGIYWLIVLIKNTTFKNILIQMFTVQR